MSLIASQMLAGSFDSVTTTSSSDTFKIEVKGSLDGHMMLYINSDASLSSGYTTPNFKKGADYKLELSSIATLGNNSARKWRNRLYEYKGNSSNAWENWKRVPDLPLVDVKNGIIDITLDKSKLHLTANSTFSLEMRKLDDWSPNGSYKGAKFGETPTPTPVPTSDTITIQKGGFDIVQLFFDLDKDKWTGYSDQYVEGSEYMLELSNLNRKTGKRDWRNRLYKLKGAGKNSWDAWERITLQNLDTSAIIDVDNDKVSVHVKNLLGSALKGDFAYTLVKRDKHWKVLSSDKKEFATGGTPPPVEQPSTIDLVKLKSLLQPQIKGSITDLIISPTKLGAIVLSQEADGAQHISLFGLEDINNPLFEMYIVGGGNKKLTELALKEVLPNGILKFTVGGAKKATITYDYFKKKFKKIKAASIGEKEAIAVEIDSTKGVVRFLQKIDGRNFLYNYKSGALSEEGSLPPLGDITGETLLTSFSVDKLLKYREKIALLDPSADEDGDGLTNEFEQKILKLRTFPDVVDSDKNGKSDAKEDFDGDNLTNLAEQQNKTNPLVADTDNDGLDDGKEITLGTNPLSPDSDNDGLDDGDELVVGTLPDNPDTNNTGVLDGNKIFTTTKTDASGIIVEVTGKGNAAKTVIINNKIPAAGSVEANIPGLIESILELHSDTNITLAKLQIPITQKMLDSVNNDTSKLKIAFMDENTKQITFPQPQGITQDGKYIWIELNHFSSYFVVNVDLFNDAFSKEFFGSTRTGTGAGGLDLILDIDSSGSMTVNDPSGLRIDASKTLISGLTDGLDKAAVIDFDSNAVLLQDLSLDLAASTNVLSRIDSSGGTDIGRAVSKAISTATANPSANSPLVILLTDGDGSYDTSLTNKAKNLGIRIYTIGLGSGVNTSLLSNIAAGTGGVYYQIASAGDLLPLFDSLRAQTVDTDGDGLSDQAEVEGMRNWFGYVVKTDPALSDTDGDGLKDGEEMNGVGQTADGKMKYNMISDPTKVDTDGDGLSDKDELFPPAGKEKTDPLKKDTDGDSIPDNLDKHPNSGSFKKSVTVTCKDDGNSLSNNHCYGINWGDGSHINKYELLNEGEQFTHTYTSAGNYDVYYEYRDNTMNPPTVSTIGPVSPNPATPVGPVRQPDN